MEVVHPVPAGCGAGEFWHRVCVFRQMRGSVYLGIAVWTTLHFISRNQQITRELHGGNSIQGIRGGSPAWLGHVMAWSGGPGGGADAFPGPFEP